MAKIDMQRHIYSPDQAVDSTVKLIIERIDNPRTGIRQHLPNADFMVPWHAGELIVVVGYTSNGKTSLVNYVVTQHAYELKAYQHIDPDYRHICVYATWEQSVEEQTIVDLSRVTTIPAAKIFSGKLDKAELRVLLEKGAEDRRKLPIYLIGSSIDDSRRKARFSMDEINEALIIIEGLGIKIDMIALDYLQRIKRRMRAGSELREGFMEIVDDAKDMAVKCPTILVSQAKRDVRGKSRDWQLPDLEDGQETSNLEQSSDHYISVWMPKQGFLDTVKVPYGYKNNKDGTREKITLEFTVTDNLLVAGFLKQKNGGTAFRAYHLGWNGSSLVEAQGRRWDPEEDKIKRRR